MKINYINCMKRLESQEDYLEKILQLSQENGVVHAIDIARGLSFSKPSVSIAMNKLKDANYIEINPKGEITLTPSGLVIAEKTLEKHEFLTSFFIKIGVDPQSAEDQACEIEHAINEETFQKLKEFLDK